jgi:adenine-specific DNA-methyltransferase
VGDVLAGNAEIKSLFGYPAFNHPKPTSLIKFLLASVLSSDKEALILDFFAGSASTAHSLQILNMEDGGNRKWILVQLPEPTPEDSPAREKGLGTIPEIGRMRIQLSENQILESSSLDAKIIGKSTLGFRSFRLANSNFPLWRVSSGVAVSELEKHINELAYFSAEEGNAFDCLIEVLMKLGCSLSVSLKQIDSEVFDSYLVEDGSLIAVVGSKKEAALEDFATLLDLKPSRLLVMEDTYQGSDELKTNLEQECSNRQIELIKK